MEARYPDSLHLPGKFSEHVLVFQTVTLPAELIGYNFYKAQFFEVNLQLIKTLYSPTHLGNTSTMLSRL